MDVTKSSHAFFVHPDYIQYIYIYTRVYIRSCIYLYTHEYVLYVLYVYYTYMYI